MWGTVVNGYDSVQCRIEAAAGWTQTAGRSKSLLYGCVSLALFGLAHTLPALDVRAGERPATVSVTAWSRL